MRRKREKIGSIRWCPSCGSAGTVGGGPTHCEICDRVHGPFEHPTPKERELRARITELEAQLASVLNTAEAS